MSRVIDRLNIEIKNSKSIIAFETTGDGNWDKWDRYITIDGKKAYHIGNVCGTCSFFFERMEGANRSISAKEITSELENGLAYLESDLLDKISLLIPNGKYYALLIEVNPRQIEIGSKDDYFSNEQIECWGEDGFWGFPHHPKINYYRGNDQKLEESKLLFEFIVPMFPQKWLNTETIKEYQKRLNEGGKPTVIAMSVLDIKEFYDSEESHYCLAHYILDGHHKLFSASIENKPITILTFFAIDQGISNIDDIDYLIKRI
ncbi:hypothetical protein [Fusibacter bizertensis]